MRVGVIGECVGEWDPVNVVVCGVVSVWVIPAFDCGSYWGDVVDSPFWVVVGVYCECWLVWLWGWTMRVCRW